jgi:hypothetical protein
LFKAVNDISPFRVEVDQPPLQVLQAGTTNPLTVIQGTNVWPPSITFPHRRQFDFPIAVGW